MSIAHREVHSGEDGDDCVLLGGMSSSRSPWPWQLRYVACAVASSGRPYGVGIRHVSSAVCIRCVRLECFSFLPLLLMGFGSWASMDTSPVQFFPAHGEYYSSPGHLRHAISWPPTRRITSKREVVEKGHRDIRDFKGSTIWTRLPSSRLPTLSASPGFRRESRHFRQLLGRPRPQRSRSCYRGCYRISPTPEDGALHLRLSTERPRSQYRRSRR